MAGSASSRELVALQLRSQPNGGSIVLSCRRARGTAAAPPGQCAAFGM